ncbi:MAG: hypothetical protein HN369_03090 [Campylobacteraceae bacterium]|nr:hypothetical protein [Campylobacteraceae bacterium]
MSNLKEAIKSVLTENEHKISYSKSVGVDGINGEKFLYGGDELKIIGRKIDAKCYKFSNYKENLIIKRHNHTRQISIPTQRDKLVLQGLLKVLQKDFPICNTDAISKIIDIKNNRNNYDSFIKIDIENFFPSINHEKLLPLIKAKTSDEVYNLVKLAITQPTVSIETPKKERDTRISNIGIPQGLPISSFLSDIFLETIDQKYKKNSKIKYYRFVDDILILCKTSDVDALINSTKKDFLDLDLIVHEQSDNKDKSSHGNIADGFQYLGYSFTNKLISVRQSSVQKLYNNINKLFITYSYKANIKKEDNADVEELIEDLFYDLNAKIAGAKYNDKKYGWINYFSEINDLTLLFKIDSHVTNMMKKHLTESDLEYLKNNNLRIKKFSKAIFEIKKKDSSYIEHPEATSSTRWFKGFLVAKDTEAKQNKKSTKNIEKSSGQSDSIQPPKEISKKINATDFRNPEKTIASLRSDVEPY